MAYPLFARLSVGEAAEAARRLSHQIADSTGELLLDGSEVVAVDAAGVQLLLAVAKELEATGRTARLVRCSPPLRRALELTGLLARLGVAPGAHG